MPTNGETLGGDAVALLAPKVFSGNESLPAERCLEIHRLMARTRAMEERMIKMSKSGQGYFWIGGPGEEAFNACLGLQVKKGRGPAYDFLHLHYRNSATLVAMGMPLLDGIRQMAMTATDTHSMGRNFVRPLLLPRLERRAGHVGHRGAVRRWRRARPWCRSASAATASPSSPAATRARPRAISPPAWSGARGRATSCRC